MNERKEIEVDEKHWQQMMAGDVPIQRMKGRSVEPAAKPVPEPTVESKVEPMPEPAVESATEPVEAKKETKERKKTGINQSDFVELFLKENRLSDRRIVYVGKETYEKLTKYVSVISDRKLGIVGYVDNIVSHHIESYKPAINELYESRIGCKVFKS